MILKRILLLFLALVLLTGCQFFNALQYDLQATEYLAKYDYENAFICSEKTIECEIEYSNAYNNLSIIYLNYGDFDNAWNCARNSRIADFQHNISDHFLLIYQYCVRNRGIDKLGTNRMEIENKLGKPDKILDQGNQYLYGKALMKFEDDRLVEVVFIN